MEARSKYQERHMQSFLREFVFIMFDQHKVIIGTFLGLFLASLLIAALLTPVYRASAKFSIIIPHQMDPLQQENYYDYKNRVMRVIQDQKELVLSNRVLHKAVENIYPGIEPERIPKMVNEVREHLEVTPPKGETFEDSSVFYVSFMGSDPKKAAHTAGMIAEAYMDSYRDITKSKTAYSFDFFKEQTDGLYNDMLEKEKNLRQYETDHAVALIEILNLEPGKTNLEVGPNALLTQSLRKLHDLQEELAGVRITINLVEKEFQNTKNPVVLPEMEVTGRAITAFKNKVAQLQIQMNELKSQFSGDFTPLKQLEQEMNLNIQSLREELQRTIQAHKLNAKSIEGKIKELEGMVKDLQEQIRKTAEEKSVYEHLKQEYTIARDAYINARNQMEQARQAKALNQEKQFLTYVDSPEAPLKPFKPNKPLIVALGLFAGLTLGIALALVLDHFDHTFKRPQEVERYLNIPVLGSLSRVGSSQ